MKKNMAGKILFSRERLLYLKRPIIKGPKGKEAVSTLLLNFLLGFFVIFSQMTSFKYSVIVPGYDQDIGKQKLCKTSEDICIIYQILFLFKGIDEKKSITSQQLQGFKHFFKLKDLFLKSSKFSPFVFLTNINYLKQHRQKNKGQEYTVYFGRISPFNLLQLHFAENYVFYKLKVCNRLASSKSIDAIFPTAFAYFLSLCHILFILEISQTFSLLYLLW